MQMSMQNNVIFDMKSVANMSEIAAHFTGVFNENLNEIRCNFARISCKISLKFAGCFACVLHRKRIKTTLKYMDYGL